MSLIHKGLLGITISSLIYKFGAGMVGVFLPLILLNEGLEIWQVCSFYVAYGLIKMAVNYPVFKFLNARGTKPGLSLGYLAGALYLIGISLFVSTNNIILLLFSVSMMAVRNSLIWNSSHLHVSQKMDLSRKSRDLAIIANLARVASIISPVVGGVLAVTFGAGWLSAVAGVIVLLAIVPIIKLDDPNNLDNGRADNLRYSLKYAPKKDLIANFGFNAHTLVGGMIWPIYLAVFIPSFTQIGYIDAISTMVAVIILHFTARRSDKGKSYNVLVEGTAMSSLAHLSRVFASSNPFTITLVSSFYDIALSYQQNPWTSIYYSHAKRRKISYILSMEIVGDFTYVIVWGILGLVAYVTKSDLFFFVAFNFAAFTAWLSLLVSRDK